MTTTTRTIVDSPAYRLEVETIKHRLGTSVTLLTTYPTANNPQSHRPFNVTLSLGEIAALRDALNEALK